jgi:hypothetical protein
VVFVLLGDVSLLVEEFDAIKCLPLLNHLFPFLSRDEDVFVYGNVQL